MDSNKDHKDKVRLCQKACFLLLGLLLFLILLEITLRLGGVVFISWQECRNRASVNKKGVYTIMCLGESTTAVGYEDSYPSQLEEILNEKGRGMKFSVINKGMVACDTNDILSQLGGNISRYKPDMVIAMMGNNDEGITYYKDIPEANDHIFRNFASYRFARLLFMQITAKMGCAAMAEPIGKSSDYRQADEYITKRYEIEPENQADDYTAEEAFKKAIRLNPYDDYAHTELGWLYKAQNMPLKSEQELKKAIELNPKNGRAYTGLILLYVAQGKLLEAEQLLKESVEPSALNNDFAYAELATIYREMGREELYKEHIQKAEAIRSRYYKPTVVSNYHKLKRILEKNNIKLVCVQYPSRSIFPLKRIFKDKKGILFVDNENIFKEALKREGYKEYFLDMFAGDFGHCTRKGNRLLASNIASVVLKDIFKD